MKRNLVLSVLLFLFMMSEIVGQDEISISQSRKATIKTMLDYRFRGGFYTLEKLFNNSVKYPEHAQVNCVIGICVVSFEVDCQGQIRFLTLKNPLRNGIDEEITNFFNSTLGKWNECDDDRYTRFDIPIQFKMKGTETNSEDAMLIYIGENPGFSCNSDEYYLGKVKKLLKKERGKRALDYINILIQRNPYNHEYYEMKKQAMGFDEN